MGVVYKPVEVEIDEDDKRICIWNKYDYQGLITLMYSTPLFKHKSQIVLSSSMRKVFLGPDPEKRRGLSNTPELSRIV